MIGGVVLLGGNSTDQAAQSSAVTSIPPPDTLPGILKTAPPWSNNTDQLPARLAALDLPQLSDTAGALHHHIQMYIYVDGNPVVVPANIGLSNQAASPLHTHDDTGLVHVESADPNFQPVLGQFMDVWGVYFTNDVPRRSVQRGQQAAPGLRERPAVRRRSHADAADRPDGRRDHVRHAGPAAQPDATRRSPRPGNAAAVAKKKKRKRPTQPRPEAQRARPPPRSRRPPSESARKRRGSASRRRPRPRSRRGALRRAAIGGVVGLLVFFAFSYFINRAPKATPLSADATAAAVAGGCADLVSPAASAPGGLHLQSGQAYTYDQHPATSGYHDPSPLPFQPRVYTTAVSRTTARRWRCTPSSTGR